MISVDFITLRRTGIKHSVLPLDSRGDGFWSKDQVWGKKFFGARDGTNLGGRKGYCWITQGGEQLFLGK